MAGRKQSDFSVLWRRVCKPQCSVLEDDPKWPSHSPVGMLLGDSLLLGVAPQPCCFPCPQPLPVCTRRVQGHSLSLPLPPSIVGSSSMGGPSGMIIGHVPNKNFEFGPEWAWKGASRCVQGGAQAKDAQSFEGECKAPDKSRRLSISGCFLLS